MALAGEELGAVEPKGADADEDATCCGFRDGNLLELDDLGTCVVR